MTLSLDSKPADGLVTAMGGARCDAPVEPGLPTTIDTGALDDISGGIIDCTPPFPPGRPWPDGLPRPMPLPGPSLPNPPTIPLGPFNPSQPKPDQI